MDNIILRKRILIIVFILKKYSKAPWNTSTQSTPASSVTLDSFEIDNLRHARFAAAKQKVPHIAWKRRSRQLAPAGAANETTKSAGARVRDKTPSPWRLRTSVHHHPIPGSPAIPPVHLKLSDFLHSTAPPQVFEATAAPTTAGTIRPKGVT